jgi:hypothetical protein
MKRSLVFILGVLLLFPAFVCLISDSLIFIAAGVAYLVTILNLIPKKFWKRFLWVNVRIVNILETKK